MPDRQQTILNEPDTTAFSGTQTKFGNPGAAAALSSGAALLDAGVDIAEEINTRDAARQAEEIVIEEANRAADEALGTQQEPLPPLKTGNEQVDRTLERDFGGLRRLGLAAKQGKISEGELGLRVESKLKELRSKFPGFEDVINNRAKATLGFDPRLSSLEVLESQQAAAAAEQRVILQMAKERNLVAINRDGTINMPATVENLNATLNLERSVSSFLSRSDAKAAQAAEAIVPAADRVLRPRILNLYNLKREFSGNDGIIQPDERQQLVQEYQELREELTNIRLGMPPAASADVQRVIDNLFDSYETALSEFDPEGNYSDPDQAVHAAVQVQTDIGTFASQEMYGAISFAPPLVLSLIESNLGQQLIIETLTEGGAIDAFTNNIRNGLQRANQEFAGKSAMQIWSDEIQGKDTSIESADPEARAKANKLHAEVFLNHRNLREAGGNTSKAYENSIASLGNAQGFQSAITHSDAARTLANNFAAPSTLSTVSSIEDEGQRLKAADTAIEYLHIQTAHEIRKTQTTPILNQTDTEIEFNPITQKFNVTPDFDKLPETGTISRIGLTPTVGGLPGQTPDTREFDRRNLERQAQRQEAQLNRWLEAMIQYKPYSSNAEVDDQVYVRELVKSLEGLGVRSSLTPSLRGTVTEE